MYNGQNKSKGVNRDAPITTVLAITWIYHSCWKIVFTGDRIAAKLSSCHVFLYTRRVRYESLRYAEVIILR